MLKHWTLVHQSVVGPWRRRHYVCRSKIITKDIQTIEEEDSRKKRLHNTHQGQAGKFTENGKVWNNLKTRFDQLFFLQYDLPTSIEILSIRVWLPYFLTQLCSVDLNRNDTVVWEVFSSQIKSECWERWPILVLQKNLIKMIGLHHPTVFYQVVLMLNL